MRKNIENCLDDFGSIDAKLEPWEIEAMGYEQVLHEYYIVLHNHGALK